MNMEEDTEGRGAAAEADELLELGCDAAEAGDLPAAEGFFRRAATAGSQLALHNLGNALRDQGQPVEAVAAFRRAADAGVVDSLRNLGQVELQLGNLAAARAAFERADAQGDALAGRELARLDEAEGRFAAAEARFAAMVASGDEAALEDYVELLGRQGKLDVAQSLINGFPGVTTKAELRLATCARHAGDVARALAILRSLEERGVCAALLPLGNLLWDELDDLEAAEAAYRRATACGDGNATYNLALLLIERGQPEEGGELMQRAARDGDEYASDWVQRNLGLL